MIKPIKIHRNGHKTKKSAKEANSSIINRLKYQGLLTTQEGSSAKAKKSKALSFLRSKRVTGKELAVFTRQIGVTLGAGLLLTEALETISEDMENVYFQEAILEIRRQIQAGSDFSASLLKFPKVFPKSYVAIVKTGEVTGRLHITMINLAKFLEDLERLKEKVKSAVRYPLFVFGFAIAVVLGMVLFLIPKFAEMYDQFDAQLPLLTRIIIGLSNFSMKYFPFILAGAIFLYIAFLYSLKNSKVRFAVDQLVLKLPIIGKPIIHKAFVSRFCRTLSFLISAGVPLKTSLDITSEVVSNFPMKKAIKEITGRVIAGSSLGAEIRKQRIFPRLVAKMVSVGERSGSISGMLEKNAVYYEDELEISLQNLAATLEPALIIFIGAIVLVVVLALYLPIFHLADAIR